LSTRERHLCREPKVTEIPLTPIFEGADAVVHLACAIQPSHDEAAMERVNVLGS
jgi:UDP-glucose 4-epimerase